METPDRKCGPGWTAGFDRCARRLLGGAGALAALLVMALTALLGQSLGATVLRKRQVERAVIERTVELRALNQTLSVEVEQRRQAEAAG